MERLFASAEILRRLNSSKRIALVVSDKSGNILDCSPGFEIALGYTKEELMRNGWHNLTHPDDLGIDQYYVRLCLERKITEYTILKRYLHKDGHPVPCNLTVMLVNGGVIQSGLFVCHCHFPTLCTHPCMMEPLTMEAELVEMVPNE